MRIERLDTRGYTRKCSVYNECLVNIYYLISEKVNCISRFGLFKRNIIYCRIYIEMYFL